MSVAVLSRQPYCACPPTSIHESGPVCRTIHYCTAHRVYCKAVQNLVSQMQHFSSIFSGLVWAKRRQILILPALGLRRGNCRDRKHVGPRIGGARFCRLRKMIRSIEDECMLYAVCTHESASGAKGTTKYEFDERRSEKNTLEKSEK